MSDSLHGGRIIWKDMRKLTAFMVRVGCLLKGEKKSVLNLLLGSLCPEALKQPILIIKTAWGGKSIHTDFRPPSLEAYVFNEGELENFKRRGKDIKELKAEKAQQTGKFYGFDDGHNKESAL